MSEWVDIQTMLDDIFDHVKKTGDQVIPADEPSFVRFIAIRQNSLNPSNWWSISITNLRRSSDALWKKDPRKARLIKECFNNRSGRTSFCESFASNWDPNKKVPSRFEREDPL